MFLESKVKILKKRAELLKAARFFFDSKGYTEVDCPALCNYPPLDDHIDVFELPITSQSVRYLHTSPEYGMKRLISEGLGSIYQISHVFRKDESGKLHNPEFTMAEWYKMGSDFEGFIEETCQFIQIFLPTSIIIKKTYLEIFQELIGINCLEDPIDKLREFLKNSPLNPSEQILDQDRDGLLQWIMGMIIEPMLQGNFLWVINDFPASQAALSEIKTVNGKSYAQRFEIYYQGTELANGYKELTDAKEQRKRFESANKKRIDAGKHPYPIAESLLKALESGLPPCCGVAAGFDRLVMLALNQSKIESVIPFNWERA